MCGQLTQPRFQKDTGVLRVSCALNRMTPGEGGGRRSRARHAAMLDIVVNSCSPSTWEAEVKRSLVQSHPGLHSKPRLKTDMVVHTSNPRTCEAEARKL